MASKSSTRKRARATNTAAPTKLSRTRVGATAAQSPQLPNEAILLIADFLDQNTLITFARTNHAWNRVLRRRIWKTLVLTSELSLLHSHFNWHRDVERTLRTVAKYLRGHRDILTYMMGSCGSPGCSLCCDQSRAAAHGLQTSQRAPQWQLEAVEHLMLDSLRGRDATRWTPKISYILASPSASAALLPHLPNLRSITIRGSRALETVSQLRVPAGVSLNFTWDHVRLPEIEAIPENRLMPGEYNVMQIGRSFMDPMKSERDLSGISKLSYHGIRLCDTDDMAIAIGALPKLTYLSLSVDPRTIPSRSRWPEFQSTQTGPLDLERDGTQVITYSVSSGEFAISFLLARLLGWSGRSGYSALSEFLEYRFPRTLRHLCLADVRKQAERLLLSVLADNLAPCRSFEKLEMIGYPEGAEQEVWDRLAAMLPSEKTRAPKGKAIY